MNAFTEQVVQQQSKIIEEITQVIQLEKTIDESAVWQGKYIASLKDKDAHIQYGQTWKQFCTDHLNVDYRTAHRRVRAYQWHSVYGIDMERLGYIPYSYLDQLYDIPQDVHAKDPTVDADQHACERAEEIIEALLSGNSVSDIYDMFAPHIPHREQRPGEVLYVRCPKCTNEFEV